MHTDVRKNLLTMCKKTLIAHGIKLIARQKALYAQRYVR